MPLAYIDATGLHLPDYPTVLDSLKAQMRAIFGDDLYLEADSQEGQMVAIFALALHDAYALAGSVYNAYSPATAQGAGLSRMVVINGLRRQKHSYSTASLRLVGAAGTIIRNGMAKDTQDRRWLLPTEVALPLSGEIVVTARAETPGDVRAGVGDIAHIATPCRGWQSVSNVAAATAGAPVEEDSSLRRRQSLSTALPSRTVFEGTVGAVASIVGVTRYKGYENDSGETDKNGILPHHICLVVEGGDDQAIAEAIALKKTPGTGTMGDITLLTRDRYDVPKYISFYRPRRVRIAALVRIRALPGYLSTTGQRIRDAVHSHINGIDIGQDVFLSRIYSPVNGADLGQRTFDVLDIALGVDGASPTPGNVPMAHNAAPHCDLGDITLEVAQ